MSFLDGYKSLIGVGLGVAFVLLGHFEILPDSIVKTGEAVALAIFGVGIAGKLEKGKQATKDLLAAIADKAAPLLIGAVLIGALGFASPASAEGDGLVHDNTLDLKVIQIGQTLAVNFGFAGAGVRVFPSGKTVVDMEPTYVDPVLGTCKLWKGAPFCGLVGQAE
ncbi:MAG: hypothetical protein WBG86_16050 [Polyangiales bacterium]